MAAQSGEGIGRFIPANGIDIHFIEAGAGEPLILLENGMISTNPIWAGQASSYGGHIETFAKHFRVIMPDFRGSGRTVHPGGPISYNLLAEDMAALIDALRLDQPLVCGYGDGGHIATITGIRKPASVRAIVNHGGYDLLNPDPQTPGLVMTRQMLGGSPDATQADPDVVAESEHSFLRVMAKLMQADHDAGQGPDHWKKVLAWSFDRFSQPCGYTVDDLHAITAPTLILAGDRDPFCSIDEGAAAYRALPEAEFAVLPNTATGITPAAVQATIQFFQRRLASAS
jgi:pimeloyl-ACP methyl ester carboxylesterase